jgi:hypothetical protein
MIISVTDEGKIAWKYLNRLGTVGIKDLIRSYIREHSNEIAIVGIMTTVLVGVTALATGDVMQALEFT